MQRFCSAVLLLAGLLGLTTAWPDCSEAFVDGLGSFEASQFNVTTKNGTIIFVLHPPLPAATKYPVMVFSHGSTGEYAMYEFAIQRYVSHGFVVVFPHIKGPKEDTSPLTVDPSGGFTIKGVEYASAANGDSGSPLYDSLDMDNVVLVGHSMGASSTIMAAMKLPAGMVKAAVAQHPGICGPYGPPPWPSTWMPADFTTAAAKMPLMLTTATNDGAFWPAPETAKHELGCFHKSTDKSPSKTGTAFAQFSADACAEDGKGGRYDRKWTTGGHDCPMKNPSVETRWVLVAAKLYGQLGGNSSSQCHAMLWGEAAGSLRKDSAVEQAVINSPGSASIVV